MKKSLAEQGQTVLAVAKNNIVHLKRCKQGIDKQIFNRKSISRKITHPHS